MPSSTLAPSSPQSPANLERIAFVVAGGLLLLPVLRRRSLLRYTAAATGAGLIYKALGDGVSLTDGFVSHTQSSRLTIRQSMTIGRSALELSAMWRSPDVIERVMQPFGEVEILGTDHLRWTLSILGKKIQVECTLAEDRPGELVHWQSTPASGFSLDERMHFKPAPQGRGTEATLQYDLDLSRIPAGATLRGVSSFFEGSARTAIRKVLHNFKSFAETGEIPTLERNPSARAKGKSNGDLI